MLMQSPSPRIAWRNRVAATVAAFTLLMLSFALMAPSASAASPKLSASKTSGLAVAGQTVNVNGSGFKANTPLFLAVCDPSVPSGGACDLTNFKQVTTSGKGAFSTSIKVVAKFGSTDCSKKSCVLMTNEPANPTATTNVATLAISFKAKAASSSAPAPQPTTSAPVVDPTTAPPLPQGTDAGKADTGSQLLVAGLALGGAVLILGAGGVVYLRRRSAQG